MHNIKLPNSPGCYLFRDEKKTIIYVGKANNIRKRVASYFQKTPLDPKTQNLIRRISTIDYIATDTEVEAFILENTLIKQYQPKYNIDLKDAKTYAFIQVTDEEFPRLLIARKKTGPGKFYGPFVSAQERDYILQFLTKTFMIRTCNKMPKKPCLRYHIGLCSAPCAGYISKEDYQRYVSSAQLILAGKSPQLLKQLDQQMKEYSKKMVFEKALERRNQIEAIKHLAERQNVQRQQTYDEDIINYLVRDGIVYLMLFKIYKGTLTNKNEFVFDEHQDFFEEFLVQYYSENPIPARIIVPVPISEPVLDFLKKIRKKKVIAAVPKRGAEKQLIDLVLKNIELSFFGDLSKVEEVKTRLHLQELPKVIECFDISHLSGTSTVGSMVQFRNGKPDKNNYRRFKIRSVTGIDDVAAIAEVVRRRYTRLLQEQSSFPDLIIIDGGIGQLNKALRELENLGLKIPIIAIAKQFEEIYMPGVSMPLRLSKKEKALHYIQEIRDEAHRFALKYNRLLRKKELIP